MDKKRPNQRPQKLDTQSIRGLVLTLAVSSTIGFWAILSKIDGVQSSGAEVPGQGLSDPLLVEEAGDLVAGLPPIPTLVPTLDPSILASLTAQAGIPAATTIDPGDSTPQLVSLPAGDNSSSKGANSPKKLKKSRNGGGNTTSTRSS